MKKGKKTEAKRIMCSGPEAEERWWGIHSPVSQGKRTRLGGIFRSVSSRDVKF